MTDRFRDLILARRGNAIHDLANADIEQFGVSIDDGLKLGLYKVNANHQIRIATSTEVGLSMDRFPIRVVI